MSGDIFGVILKRRQLLVFSGQKPGMLLNILPCTIQPPQQRIGLALRVNSSEVEKPWVTLLKYCVNLYMLLDILFNSFINCEKSVKIYNDDGGFVYFSIYSAQFCFLYFDALLLNVDKFKIVMFS